MGKALRSQESEGGRRPPPRPRRIAVVLGAVVALIALATRAPAPWRLPVTNDEMHHLESWRNRYRTDDIYPLFIRRLEETNRLGPARLAQVKRIYHSGALAQRGLIVLVDPQPPLFPVMAETIEAATRSSLAALRIPSMLASLAAVGFAFLLGRALRDDWTGLWVAALFGVGFLAQAFAGIGRPYAIAQCAVLAAAWSFVVHQETRPRSPWRFLLLALVAQGTQWMAWAVVGPMVLIELARRWREVGWKRVVRQTWWYALTSALLLVEMAIQLKNPAISNQAAGRALGDVARHFATASPFAHLARFGMAGLAIAGALFLILIVAGMTFAWTRWRRRDASSGEEWAWRGLLLAAIASIAAPMLVGTAIRFWMTYAVIPTVLAGVAAAVMLRSPRLRAAGLAVVLLALGSLSLARPWDPYTGAFTADARYDVVARELGGRMRTGDAWIAFPYFCGNCLYRYGKFPEPRMPSSDAEFKRAIGERPRDRGTFVFASRDVVDPARPEFAGATWRRYENDFALIEFPAAEAAAPQPR
jgi:hypothetical protein